jgi:hypothetical protein
MADGLNEAGTLGRIGDTHEGMGDVAGAAEAWRQALDVLEGLGYPEVGERRRKLRPLSGALVRKR